MTEAKNMMYAQEKTIQVHVGILKRAHLREMLESERFSGRHLRWLETRRGFWSKTVFSIRGHEKDVSEVGERIQFWLMCSGESQ